ncbi:BA75_00110T0 [Komagataella pastoris]|uniref:BA75_00110T0 n=1 Tax=Komagataella pastoris TaxID=4922 RepID=A0A1B2J701_PICPA|nr:BA75_00110T0 [Komagataella pastoris]
MARRSQRISEKPIKSEPLDKVSSDFDVSLQTSSRVENDTDSDFVNTSTVPGTSDEKGKQTMQKKPSKTKKRSKNKIEPDSIPAYFEWRSTDPDYKKLDDDPYLDELLHFENTLQKIDSSSRVTALALKDRIFHCYGFNFRVLKSIVDRREDWVTNVFHPSVSTVASGKYNIRDIELTSLPETNYQPFLKTSDTLPKLDRTISLKLDDSQTMTHIHPSMFIDVPNNNDRVAKLLNTGGFVLETVWLPSYVAEKVPAYLLISLKDHDPQDGAFNPQFSVFKRKQYPSALQIYKINPNNLNSILLVTFYLKTGGLTNLKVLSVEDNVVQLLALCSEKTIQLYKFVLEDTKGGVCVLVDKPSLELSLKDLLITSFDMISSERIIFGTSSGTIGEFDLANKDILAPIYLYQTPLQSVVLLKTNGADLLHDDSLNSELVVITSMDYKSLILDLADIVKLVRTDIKQRYFLNQIEYSPFAKVFIATDDTSSLTLFASRDPTAIISGTSHTNRINRVGVSPLHPMTLSGSVDGEVRISNSFSSIFFMARNKSKPVSLCLWKLEHSSAEDGFRLGSHWKVGKAEQKVTLDATIFPNSITFTSLSWNESISSCNLYAAASASGLVILEALESGTTKK